MGVDQARDDEAARRVEHPVRRRQPVSDGVDPIVDDPDVGGLELPAGLVEDPAAADKEMHGLRSVQAAGRGEASSAVSAIISLPGPSG